MDSDGSGDNLTHSLLRFNCYSTSQIMKIAVLSDIHGNFPALEAVADHLERWQPERVLVAGDIVNRGPRSQDCLGFLKEKQRDSAWQMIRGNHEDYVISCVGTDDPIASPKYDISQPVIFTYHQLIGDIDGLVALPESYTEFDPERGDFRMVHASMRYNREGIYPETNNLELEAMIQPAPRVFITGHTHRPLVRSHKGTLIVNVGSVGLPFDGDKRAGYAQITWQKNTWQAEIIRLNYDIQQSKKDFYDTGFLEGGGPLSQVILLELDTALSQLYHWSKEFVKPVLAGEITVSEATEKFLSEPVRTPY